MARIERDELDLEGARSLLKSKRMEDKKRAIAELRRIGDASAAQVLLECLEDPVWLARERASRALIGLGKIASRLILEHCSCQDMGEDRAYWLLQTLTGLGQEGVKGILTLAASPRGEIRGHAFRIIGRGKIKEGISLLARGLGDREWKNRRIASEALICFGTSVYASLQKLFMDSIRDETRSDFNYWCARTLGRLWPDGILEAYTPYLRDKDWSIRLGAIVAIGSGGSPKSIPALAAALFDPVPQIRDHAQRFLRRQGALAVEHLSRLYSKANSQQRIFLATNMGRILGPAGVEVGRKLVVSKESALRMDGLTILGETRHPDAVMPIMTAFRDSSWQVRDHASSMVARIGPIAHEQLVKGLATKYEDIRYWTVITLGRIGGKREIEALEQAAGKDDMDMQAGVVRALEELHTDEAHQIAVKLLDSSFWNIRARACSFLVSRGPQVIPRLMKIFEEGTENATYWAMKVFIGLGDKAVEALEDILQSSNQDLRSQAYLSLGMIASPRSMTRIIEAFRRGDETLCYFIIKALASADSEEMVRYLVDVMPGSDSSVNRWISLLLQRVGRSGMEMLLKGLARAKSSEIAYWYLKALKNSDQPAILPHVMPFLEDRNPQVRQEAMEAITEVADESCAPMLIKLIQDPNPEIQKAAIPVLASIGDPGCLKVVLQTMDKADQEIQGRILDYFGRTPSRPMVDALMVIMSSESSKDGVFIRACELLLAICRDEEFLEEILQTIPGAGAHLGCNLAETITRGGFDIPFLKWKNLFEECEEPQVRRKLAIPISAFLFSADTESRGGATRWLTDSMEMMVPYLLGVAASSRDAMMKLTISQFVETLGERVKPTLEQVVASEDTAARAMATELLESMKVAYH